MNSHEKELLIQEIENLIKIKNLIKELEEDIVYMNLENERQQNIFEAYKKKLTDEIKNDVNELRKLKNSYYFNIFGDKY